MIDALFACCSALFPLSVLPSLTAVACLACLSQFGGNASLHVATASALFVFGYLKESDSENDELQDESVGEALKHD